MADYDIFREQLAIRYPTYGHALWGPGPRNPNQPVQVGDVGFIRRGKFYRFFNALLPADDPSHQELGVPEYHEPLVPHLSDHIGTDSLDRNNYYSAGVSVEPDTGYWNENPDDSMFRRVSFRHGKTPSRGAAVLSLPVTARREDTLALEDFKWWIVRHIDNWFAFVRKLRLGIEHMEDTVLVTGCDLARSWTNIAFLGGQDRQVDSQVSFGVKVEDTGSSGSINFRYSPENAQGAVLRCGPEGSDLPENQCVFIRGFRVARTFWILPRRLKAAAGPSPDPGGHDYDTDMEVISISAVTKYRDPLHLLLEYISEQASDCDIVLVHDNDLVMVDGLGLDTQSLSVETLETDVIMDLLRRSNIEIHKVSCELSRTDSGPNTSNTDASVVKVAMLSMALQNRSSLNLPYRHDGMLGHAPSQASWSTTPAQFPQLNTLTDHYDASPDTEHENFAEQQDNVTLPFKESIIFPSRPSCPICGKRFKRVQERNRHVKSYLPQSLYCPYPGCTWTGRRQRDFGRHWQRHRNASGVSVTGEVDNRLYDPTPLVGGIVDGSVSPELAVEWASSFVQQKVRELDMGDIWPKVLSSKALKKVK